jgi:hypothetical protein
MLIQLEISTIVVSGIVVGIVRTLVQRRARPKKSPLLEAMVGRLFNKQQTKPVHFFFISLEHVNWISHLAGRAVNIHGKSF